MSETPVCIFCGQGPTEVEDVIPKWMHRYLPRQQGSLVITGNPSQGYGIRKSMAFVQTAKVVCNSCNNHWMSDVEDRASRWLKKMMFRPRVSLAMGPLIQTRLATWGLLKALLMPYLTSDPHGAVIARDYGELYQLKQPWPQVSVFLAQVWGVDISDKEASGLFPDSKAYGITFNIHTIVVQVFAHNMTYSIRGGIPFPKSSCPTY